MQKDNTTNMNINKNRQNIGQDKIKIKDMAKCDKFLLYMLLCNKFDIFTLVSQ